MADAKVEWQKVEGNWTDIKANQERSLYFCVPPGTGAVYIKNPVVTP
jgi:hypothetical protein